MVHTSVTKMTQNAVMEDDVSSDGIEVGFNEGNGLGTVDGESDNITDGNPDGIEVGCNEGDELGMLDDKHVDTYTPDSSVHIGRDPNLGGTD